MSLPAFGGGSAPLPSTQGYTPPTNQRYLPNVNWATPATSTATRDDLNSVATAPEDQQLQVAAENAPIRVVYGRTRIGAQIADVLTYQNKLIIVAVWCEGEIDAIESIQINDKSVPAGVTVTSYGGTPGQTVNATLVAAYASHGITFTDTFPGIAYSVVQVATDATDGFPQLAAVIRGKKLYDPRTTTTVYSNNPALALADFIVSNVYGMDRSVDWASVTTVANACDAMVGSEKRRLIGLVIDSTSPCSTWSEALRTYASCWLSQEGVFVRLVADKTTASTATFTGANIVAGSLKLKKRGVQNVPTLIDIRYTDTSIVPWSEKSAIAKMSGVDAGTTPRRESQVSLPGVHRYSQAYREAVERLNKLSLSDLMVDFTAFDEALAVQVGDVITVTHPIGLTSKLLRVTAVSAESAGRWQISSVEYDPAAYSDVVQTEPTYSDTALPNPAAPPALSGLATTEEVYQLDNGTYSSRIRATWTPADYAYLSYYRVEIYQAGTLVQTATAREAAYASPTMQEGFEYVVKVAAVTAIGAVGVWSQSNINILGKYLIPGDVPSIQVFEAGGRVYVSWGAAIDLDIWRYEVRYGATAGTWDTATLIDRVDALRLSSDQIPVGTWRIWIKALDSVGQYSTTPATATVVVTSDASAFLVDDYDSNAAWLDNMQSYTLRPPDENVYYVTEDAVAFGAKFSGSLSTYGNVLATYHSNVASSWLGEAEDFGQLLGGQWTGTCSIETLSGSVISYIGFSPDATTWTFIAGLSHKTNARFTQLYHGSLNSSTFKVTVPTQNIRVDAIPREEVGTGTSSAAGPVTITLANVYVAVKKLTITPQGTTARSATYDNIVIGASTTFDVYVFNDSGVKIASPFRYEFQGV
jgi:hypothetical protein